MTRALGVPALAALLLLGGCDGVNPEETLGPVGELGVHEGAVGELDLSVEDLVASCQATSLTLSAVIQNKWTSGIGGSTAAVYAGGTGAGGTRLGTISVPFLVGGERFPFQLSFTVPEGTQRVVVVADDDGVFEEGDETNNIASFDFPIPCATNQGPVALCQNITVAADATCKGVASVNHGSYDPDGFPGPFSVTQLPSGPFSLGTTPVQLDVTDGASTNSCAATVTVVDTTAPVLGASRGLVLTPSVGSDYVLVSLADCALPATDNCGGELSLAQTGTLMRVSSDEPNDALSLLRLLACDDIKLSQDGKSALVRAEAALLGNGRVYTFTYGVKDATGNQATGACQVRVPALLGNPAVDSGVTYCQGAGCPSGTTGRGLLCSLLPLP
ncbi:CARDB domain-containing protein [Corallococcus terminator]